MNINTAFKGKTILLTGHTGFKGSWLAAWLVKLGAQVVGYSLAPDTEPAHINKLNLDIVSIEGDIRDLDKLKKTFQQYSPDVVLHLAAQPLVRKSYEDPIETYEINVIGTLKVFEAARSCSSVKAIVNVTSDKCYENKEWAWGYRESDPMGGYDPYSSSKGCSELLTASYRNSYFSNSDFPKNHQTLMATARAGNVIGGGDWAECRLIPDAMRALEKNETIVVRSPKAIRPWQHVLEPLRGYLVLAAQLLEQNKNCAASWNFGPHDNNCVTVEELLTQMKTHWQGIDFKIEDNPYHEATFLKLDSSKAKNQLGFSAKLNLDQTLQLTADWYQEFYKSGKVITNQQIDWYMDLCSQ